jgi:hypothetical protein
MRQHVLVCAILTHTITDQAPSGGGGYGDPQVQERAGAGAGAGCDEGYTGATVCSLGVSVASRLHQLSLALQAAGELECPLTSLQIFTSPPTNSIDGEGGSEGDVGVMRNALTLLVARPQSLSHLATRVPRGESAEAGGWEGNRGWECGDRGGGLVVVWDDEMLDYFVHREPAVVGSLVKHAARAVSLSSPLGLLPYTPAPDYRHGEPSWSQNNNKVHTLEGVGGGGDGGGVLATGVYGPMVPEELMAAALLHPPVALQHADDKEYVRRQNEREQDRRDDPHRYFVQEGAAQEGVAERSEGERRDDEWRPVRERYFDPELGMILSGLPPGERMNEAPAPLDQYPVSPLPTSWEEFLAHRSEVGARLMRAQEEQRRQAQGPFWQGSSLGLSRVGEPWRVYGEGEREDMPDGGFTTGNFTYPPPLSLAETDMLSREGAAWDADTPLDEFVNRQGPAEWFMSRPVLLEHMHRLRMINSSVPTLEELEAVVAWDAMGFHQPHPMSYLRNNAALRKATTWLSHGFVFHKDAATFRRPGLLRLKQAKETLARLPAVLLQLHSLPAAGRANGGQGEGVIEDSASGARGRLEEKGWSEWCRAELGLECHGVNSPLPSHCGQGRGANVTSRKTTWATTWATTEAIASRKKLPLPSARWSIQEAIDECARAGYGAGEGKHEGGEAIMVEVCGNLAWSPAQGDEISIGAHVARGGEDSGRAGKERGRTGVVLIAGVVNETRARRVPALDTGTGSGEGAGLLPPAGTRVLDGGSGGGQDVGRGEDPWHVEKVVGARSLAEQEQQAVFHDGFHFEDEPPGAEGGFGQAEWGREGSWRSLPSLHTVSLCSPEPKSTHHPHRKLVVCVSGVSYLVTPPYLRACARTHTHTHSNARALIPYAQHPTHNGIDRGLVRMRGGWVEVRGGACVIEALRMERVPGNCTPDLLPENDEYVCLQIRGVWSIGASEVVSCHGTAILCEGQSLVQVRRANVGGIHRNPRYWASYGLNASDEALVSIDQTRFSDTMFGGVVAGGRSWMSVSRSEFVRNEPSLVILEDAVLAVDRSGFSEHAGHIFQTLVYGSVRALTPSPEFFEEMLDSHFVLLEIFSS